MPLFFNVKLIALPCTTSDHREHSNEETFIDAISSILFNIYSQKLYYSDLLANVTSCHFFCNLADHYSSDYSVFMLIRLSRNSSIIAVQLSLKNILVIDSSINKSWNVCVGANFGTNSILPGGVIWSEHGGNSQDLILVTSNGLELYKVSSLRSQCKLSRTIPVSSTCHFLYDPVSRLILLVTSTRIGTGTIDGTDEQYLFRGYFLRTEKSEQLITMELPPPDKVPKFRLGRGFACDDLALVNLYGDPYCVVRHKGPVDGGRHCESYLMLHRIYKSTRLVVATFKLMLSQQDIAQRVVFSAVGNLLLCHSCVSVPQSEPLASAELHVFDIRGSSTNAKAGNSSSVHLRNNGREIFPNTNEELPILETIGTCDANRVYYHDSDINTDAISDGVEQGEGGGSGDSQKLKLFTVSSSVSSDTASLCGSIVKDDETMRPWMLELDLAASSACFRDRPVEALAFLSRRGRGSTNSNSSNSSSSNSTRLAAKKLMIDLIVSLIERRVDLGLLSQCFDVIVQQYALTSTTMVAALIPPDGKSESISTDPKVLPTRPPLEPPDALHSLLPDISSIALQTRAPKAASSSTAAASAPVSSGGEFETVPLDSVPLSSTAEVMVDAATSRSTTSSDASSGYEHYVGIGKAAMLSKTVELQVSVDTEQGDIAISQTELLSHVWLPAALGAAHTGSASARAFTSYLSRALTCYMAAVLQASWRGFPMRVEVALALLSLQLLRSLARFEEVLRLLREGVLPDSADIAMALLDMIDVEVEREATEGRWLGDESSSSRRAGDGSLSVSQRERLVSLEGLREGALSMLWRIGAGAGAGAAGRVFVVRRLLQLGRVLDAIRLCRREGGAWPAGLTRETVGGVASASAHVPVSVPAHVPVTVTVPVPVSGVEFFRAAVYHLEEVLEIQPCAMEEQGPNLGNDDDIEVANEAETDGESAVLSEVDRHWLLCMDLLYSVHDFLLQWEPALLTTTPASGVSSLAAQVAFPDHLFTLDLDSDQSDSIHSHRNRNRASVRMRVRDEARRLFGFVAADTS